MRKIFLVVFAVVLVTSLVLGACAKPAPAPAPAPTPAPAPAPAPAPVKPIKLLWATAAPPTDPSVPSWEAWAQEVEERTGGRVTVEFSFAGAVGGPPEIYDRLLSGACDITFFFPFANPGRFPVSEVMNLPVRGSPTALTSGMLALLKKGYFDKEFADVKKLWFYAMGTLDFWWADKPATAVEDFKGRKIRYSGGVNKTVIESLEAVPVSIPYGEVYLAVEKGTVDGIQLGWATFTPAKLYEVTKYCTEINMNSLTLAVVMNKETWSKLPQDVQAIIEDTIATDKYPMMGSKLGQDSIEPAKEVFLAAGGRIDHLSTAELAKMDALLAHIWEEWIAGYEAQGVPVKNMLADLYSALESAGVEKPFVGYTP